MPSIQPITRTQERITFDDGKKVRRCYGPHNPHYFQADSGLLLPINFDQVDTSAISSIGSITKKDHNIRSLGIRNDLRSTKLFGVRPDWDQSGKIQMEVTPITLKANALTFTPTANKIVLLSSIKTDFGPFSLLHNRHFSRFCVQGDDRLESFELKLRFDLTGLDVQYRADLDEYWFYAGGEFFGRIRKPLLLDPESLNSLRDEEAPEKFHLLGHDLQQNGDGSWTYTKYSKDNLQSVGLPAYLIDGDVYYSTTADGYVYVSNANFTTARSATIGTGMNNTVPESDGIYGSHYTSFYIGRSFFYFNTSGVIAANVTDCIEKIYCHATGAVSGDVMAMKGTQADTLITDDYNNFTGSSYGSNNTWAASQYNSITFNATGIGDIVNGITKVCNRNLSKDFNNVSPGTSTFEAGVTYADKTGTTYDPYLDITETVLGNPWNYFAQQQ